jgi:hypothetical protein
MVFKDLILPDDIHRLVPDSSGTYTARSTRHSCAAIAGITGKKIPLLAGAGYIIAGSPLHGHCMKTIC